VYNKAIFTKIFTTTIPSINLCLFIYTALVKSIKKGWSGVANVSESGQSGGELPVGNVLAAQSEPGDISRCNY